MTTAISLQTAESVSACVEKQEVRDACVIICAHDGDVRAARSLIVRGFKRHGIKPGRYMSARESRSYGQRSEPRYTFTATREVYRALCESVASDIRAEGWTGHPLDFYQD